MGIHGEPGVARGKLKPADEIVDEMLDRILGEMSARAARQIAVLVNGLGATPLMELYIMNRRVRQRLDAAGLAVHATTGRQLVHLARNGGRLGDLHASRRGTDDDARPSLRLRDVPGRLMNVNAAALRAIRN